MAQPSLADTIAILTTDMPAGRGCGVGVAVGGVVAVDLSVGVTELVVPGSASG
jgi:hypothetical protein